ncbi:glycosyltransferase [Ottowia sp. VDI28]|uniref:glycosyltransferase n=1 Tax=Ottowia sp. VDI28 TaxID=3133968 RepID=UPI003C2F1AA9
MLANLNKHARVVRTGQTEATALTVILENDHLLVPLAGSPRPDTHILGVQQTHTAARDNWEKLIGTRRPALMPVYRVCNCMAEIQILDGQEFEDAATTPAWKKVRGMIGQSGYDPKGEPVPFDQWRIWMSELALGLDELEKLGLAHGDPYPFNAIRTASNAAWVDFGHLTDDPVQRFKDAWAFVLFTVLHTQRLSTSYSPGLLKNLASALAKANLPGRFDRIRQVLSERYQDVELVKDVRVPSLIFAEAVAEQSQNVFGDPDLSKLLLKASIQYFSDFLHHIQRGNQYFTAFHVEQQRHRFMEQETLRLTVPKAEHTSKVDSINLIVTERDAQLAICNQQITELDVQLKNLNKLLAARDEELSYLRGAMSEREEQISLLNVTLSALEKQVHSLGSGIASQQEQLTKLSQIKAAENQQQTALERMLSERDIEIAELQQNLAHKEGLIVHLNQTEGAVGDQVVNLNQIIVQREEHISELNRIVEEHGAHVRHLTETANTHYEHLSQILASRSWKITRPMRAAARFIKWGGLTDSDRGKLYNHAKRAYHRIPVSYQTKLVFRKYFLKITGWTPATPAMPNRGYMPAPLAFAQNPQVGTPRTLAPLAANLSALIQPRITSQRIPYFGVRRPEGTRRVAILTNQLLDWHDGRPRFGGGERYALELARLLKELSFDVTFYQPSFKAPGEGEYYGFKVILLRTADSIGEFHHGLCSEFTALTQDFDHVYYHLPEYASGKVREDGLMTCHGIWFDHNNYPQSIFRTPEWFEQLHSAFSSPRCVVSVDTNSIGVIRSLWPELASTMRFIPNFYDAASYFPQPESRDRERLTILFPRRSQINRGSRIFGEIVSLIPHDVEIIWLGEGDPVDTQIVQDVCRNDKRASFAVADFDQMPQWYQKADIAVIPTIACEGTSLSCIEALAVGCAVVSTNVGGLPDLIYDGMNGLLVDPDARSIAAAINRLIVDRELRERLQKSAHETAHHFELKRWRERWADVLHDYGWVTDRAINTWKRQQGGNALPLEAPPSDKWLILTRNAIHGGVESLIREEAKGLNAPVVVCGGHDRKDTCPFEYTRADDQKALRRVVAEYDVILYHWLPDWCLDVLRDSGKRCIEFVHRTDTAESDKTVPTALVTHSAFLARYVHEACNRSCRVVDHPIAIDRFKPQPRQGRFVGAITSYYDTKGIDIFLNAWAQLKSRFPEHGVRFYGAGDDLPKFRKLASELELDVDFREATSEPWEAMKDFACFVVPSRIEGLPVAILEALAMNIPVVASDLPGMVEFNQLSEARGYSGFVHLARKEDPQDFAAVMSQVLASGTLKDSSAYINDYYSPEKHCADLVSIYRELCH